MLIATLIFFPMLAAPAVYALGKRRENATETAAAAVTAVELALSALLWRFPGTWALGVIFPGGLRFCVDGFRMAYCVLAALLWCFTTLFGREYFRHEREGIAGYWCFVLLTLGATEGLFLAADFPTAFCFFEVLSLSSFPWVAQEREDDAVRAARTYLAVAVIGGLILLMGLWLLLDAAGTLDFAALPDAMAGVGAGRALAAGLCILLGFGAKAGMFPLHVWLPKAHPVAPAPASALLSGMLTKVGVFGVLQLSLRVVWGDKAFGLTLLALAVITMVLGAVLAVFSENLKRTLACSSMSQIGFILTGLATMVLSNAAGEAHAAELALTGALLHMVNHSLLKLLLFLSAGAVAMNLRLLRLRDVQGWGRSKPLLKAVFALGVVGIGGVPGFNGYVSKTLLHEGLSHLIAASGEAAWLYRGAEVLFLFSGGLTFAYMLRLFVCVFVERNADPARQARYDEKAPYLSPLSAAVLVGSAALLLPMGAPAFATALGARMSGLGRVYLEAFAWENLQGALISLAVGAIVYFGFIRGALLRGRLPKCRAFDLEEDVYRPLLLKWLPAILGVPARILGENVVLHRLPLSLPTALARAMGENAAVRGVADALVLLGVLLGRMMDSSLDALTLLLRRTLLREERVRDERALLRDRRLRTFHRATSLALSRVVDNFSFAMMMACVGVILVFVTLALALYHGA